MLKKVPPIVYICAALLVGTIGFNALKNNAFQPQPASSDSKTYGDSSNQLTVLGDTFSGYSTLRSDVFAEKVTQRKLGVRYENEFDQKKRAQRLGNDADIIVTSLDQFLLNRPNGKIVGLIDKTIGADAVVLNTKVFPQLKTLNDLKSLKAKNAGLKIVYSAGTPSEYLAKLLDIRFEGFEMSDFQTIEVEEAGEAYKQLQQDKNVAVAILWEPFVSSAKRNGNTVVLSSKDIPDSIVDVIVASDKLINGNPKELKNFLTAYYQQNDSLVRNKGQLHSQITKDSGLKLSEAQNVANGIDFFSSVEASKWMSDGHLSQRIQATAAVLTLTGDSIGSFDKANELYSSAFIQDAVAEAKKVISVIGSTDPELAKILDGEKTAKKSVSSATIQSSQDVGNLSVKGVVEFSTGSATLTAKGRNTLDDLAASISDFSPSTTAINVVGHTSKTGSALSNQSLSESRAKVVADYLRSYGVKIQIASEGKGFSSPILGIAPVDARNQRTEIQLKRIEG